MNYETVPRDLKLTQLNYMSVVAMESQCMKTVTIHLVDKSDFILSDRKTRCKSSYIYHFSTVVDFSSEKYKGSTRHSTSREIASL